VRAGGEERDGSEDQTQERVWAFSVQSWRRESVYGLWHVKTCVVYPRFQERFVGLLFLFVKAIPVSWTAASTAFSSYPRFFLSDVQLTLLFSNVSASSLVISLCMVAREWRPSHPRWIYMYLKHWFALNHRLQPHTSPSPSPRPCVLRVLTRPVCWRLGHHKPGLDRACPLHKIAHQRPAASSQQPRQHSLTNGIYSPVVCDC